MCSGMFIALTSPDGGGVPTMYLLLADFYVWNLGLIVSFFVVSIHSSARVSAFVVVAGVILSICAALPWIPQGSLTMAYPTKARKGMFYMYQFGNLDSWRGCGLCCSIQNRLQEYGEYFP
ncbi:hypothetical protein F4604DRAFT_645236 [Suillus subluteus]|nr:hypothetical protein F4604DRAFT_645236 [Suillus subluteus]